MRLATLIGLNANGEGNASMLENSNKPSTAVPIPTKQAARMRFTRRSEPAKNVPHNIASPALEANATRSQLLNNAPNKTAADHSIGTRDSSEDRQSPLCIPPVKDVSERPEA